MAKHGQLYGGAIVGGSNWLENGGNSSKIAVSSIFVKYLPEKVESKNCHVEIFRGRLLELEGC